MNFVGQTIGWLSVVKELPRRKPYSKHRLSYKCVCECGAVVVKRNIDLVQAIKNNWNSSCNQCLRLIRSNKDHSLVARSRIGEKHGRLTIININTFIDKHNNRRYKMLCRCECGGIIKSFYNELKRGVTKSCGCYNREQSSVRGSTIGINNLTKGCVRHKWHYITNKNIRINMRSGFEVMYAKILDNKHIKWEYEPRCFRLNNTTRYTPDFYLPETNEYVEVKGWLDDKQKLKYDLFESMGYKLQYVFRKDLEKDLQCTYNKFLEQWKIDNKNINISN